MWQKFFAPCCTRLRHPRRLRGVLNLFLLIMRRPCIKILSDTAQITQHNMRNNLHPLKFPPTPPMASAGRFKYDFAYISMRMRRIEGGYGANKSSYKSNKTFCKWAGNFSALKSRPPPPNSVYKCKIHCFNCLRSHNEESTRSRQITEVKHRLARQVLGWGTAWESRVA